MHMESYDINHVLEVFLNNLRTHYKYLYILLCEKIIYSIKAFYSSFNRKYWVYIKLF